MALPSEAELSDQLFRAAEGRARQHGLIFGPGAESDLHNLAETSAAKILTASKGKPSEAQETFVRGSARVAAESFATLVDEMTSARLRINGYLASHPTSIGEQTLASALSALCPLWPIC